MGRTHRLLDRPPDEIEMLLGHPAQSECASLIAELVSDLRSLRKPAEYYEFQRGLGAHVYDAQRRQAEASRNAKRQRAGRKVPECEFETWDLAVVLWDRIVRQLRAVGDALAWRLFQFDRRVIVALSQNDPPGPFVDKEGLGWELGAVKEAWESDGAFALLHDLTNSIRIGDITIFGRDRPEIMEVKKPAKSSGSRKRQQLRRAVQAVAAINEGAPLPGAPDTDLLVSDQPFKTHLPALRKLLEAALAEGAASRSIGREQVLTTVALTAPAQRPFAELAAATAVYKRRAYTKASLDQVKHRLRGVRADSIGRDRLLAPFTIYPVSPVLAALLTTDLVTYEYVVGWDRLEDAFEAQGFDVEVLLEDADGGLPEDVAHLHDRRMNRRVTIHSGGLDQLLHELVDIERFAAAIATAARTDGREDRRAWVLTFANERAVWR